MRDYVQKTRHIASCIITKPIDMASQVHVFVSGMREGMTRYCLTRAEPSSLEEAFALALREDYVVASSYVHPTFVDVLSSGPEPMDIDTIESSGDRRRGSSDRGAARKERPMICYRGRKQGHRAAVCRAPAPVMVQAASADPNGAVPAAHPKNGRDQ